MKIDKGLVAMWSALALSSKRLDLAITLIFLRQLLDPTAPLIAGHDPRELVSDAPTWQQLRDGPCLGESLDTLAKRINELAAEQPLEYGFAALDAHTVKAAVDAVSAWEVEPYLTGGDMLGELLQQVRPPGNANGAFYTPYQVSYMMAMVLGPQPGERAIDPACGSGRMLLAQLQVCRVQHGGEPELFGMDLDGDAVRVCRLNLLLAGYGCNRPAVELKPVALARDHANA
jgi:hypothetical protein